MAEQFVPKVKADIIKAVEGEENVQPNTKEFLEGEEKAFEPGKVASNFNMLKEQAPDLHELMIESIAQRIVDDMKKGQERMKKAWRGNQ